MPSNRTFKIINQSETKEVNLIPATLSGVMGGRGGLGPTRVPVEALQGGGVVETYQLVVLGTDHDEMADTIQTLQELLLLAMLFKDDVWQNEPVYLYQQTNTESNPRYARITGWLEYEYPDLYGNPFSQSNVMDPLIITIIREHPWSSLPVGALGDAVTLTASDGPASPTKVHIANFRDDGVLTEVKVDDGGAFTDIIAAATGTDLWPAAPADEDHLYFGASGDTPCKHYCVNVSKAMTAFVGNFVLEYWDGADWDTATVLGTDYTIFAENGGEITDIDQLFTQTGLWSINVFPWDDWAKVAIDGDTDWWIRIRIEAFTSMATIPEKNEDAIYSQSSNFVEIPAASLIGDAFPLVDMRLWSPSGGSDTVGAANISRVLIGVKSEHGNVDLDNFEPMLNAGDEDNPAACTITYGTDTSAVANNKSPGGYHAYCDYAGDDTLIKRVTYTLEDLLPSYEGEYRLLVGVQQTGGDPGDTQYKGRLFIGGASDHDEHADTRVKSTRGADDGIEVLDLGFVRFPFSRAYYADSLAATDIIIEIHSGRNTGTSVTYIEYAYLLPISEGSVGADDPVADTTYGSSALRGGCVLDIDAGLIANRTQKFIYNGTNLVPAREWGRFNRPIEFRNLGIRTRLYFLMLHYTANGWNTEPLAATLGCHLAFEMFANYGYTTLRGTG